MNVFLGIDFGTSGARAIAIDAAAQIQAQVSQRTTTTDWRHWQPMLFGLIEQLPLELRNQTRAIAINGTSATVLLCDATGTPVTEALLYNDDRAASELPTLQAVLEAQAIAGQAKVGQATVLSATSSLVKLLWWQHQPEFGQARYLMHQADWLAYLLHGQPGISDYHNSLKLGYDVINLRYPAWMDELNVSHLLPTVVAPGTPIASLNPQIATRLALPPDCLVCAGTTDSIAAFLASGATQPGEAVTSLGSTLVLKLLSQTAVEDSNHGIYSHRFGDRWLVGGASNTGGAVLQQFFTPAELAELSQQIDVQHPSPLDYYPLLRPGDRFPINDPQLPPRLEPRPEDAIAFLHGLLESMARIEAEGYRLLQALGATPLQQVFTAGGGAANAAWTAIRARHLGVPVTPSRHTEAAYGTALLANRSLTRDRKVQAGSASQPSTDAAHL